MSAHPLYQDLIHNTCSLKHLVCSSDLEMESALRAIPINFYRIVSLHLDLQSLKALLETSNVCILDFVQAAQNPVMEWNMGSPLEVDCKILWRARGTP